MINLDEVKETSELREIDAFFVTLQNESRFSDREKSELPPSEEDTSTEHLNGESSIDQLSSVILYPPIIPHTNMADR